MNAPKVLIKMAEKENTGEEEVNRNTGAVKAREERRYRFLTQEVVQSGHFKLYFSSG